MNDNQDVVYFNCNSICRKVNATDPDVPCSFSEMRNTPIITNASDYQFSIIRTTVDAKIPAMIPKMASGNNTTYQIKLTLAFPSSPQPLYSATVNIAYVCTTKYATMVTPPFDYSNPYYYIYNIQDFIDMFNQTMIFCLGDIQSAIGGAHTITSVPPKMVLQNNNIEIYYDSYGFGEDATGVERCRVYVNDDLMNLLNGFSNQYAYDALGMNYELIIKNRLINNQTINSKLYYVESQSYSSLSSIWSPVSSIVYISAMGILSESMGSLYVLNNTSSTAQSDNIESQVCDISLSLTNPQEYSGQIQYVASVFRFSDIQTREIRNVNLSLYWKCKYNNINYPVLMVDGAMFNCKIMFQKKR